MEEEGRKGTRGGTRRVEEEGGLREESRPGPTDADVAKVDISDDLNHTRDEENTVYDDEELERTKRVISRDRRGGVGEAM